MHKQALWSHDTGRPCLAALALATLTANAMSVAAQRRPNPPVWPESVQVFGPEDDVKDVRAAVNQAFKQNGGQKPMNHGEFSSARFAFLFKPGKYAVDVPVGYYTQVLGLGAHPDDVTFDSRRGIYCEESNKQTIFGSLSTFWRGAENFRTRGGMLWATSQATPVRRAIVDGDLSLSEYKKGIGMGYSSGGFVGNVRVGGKLQAASQQQYCMRNSQLVDGVSGGVWNMVYVGTEGAPESHCGFYGDKAGTTSIRKTPVIAEKPFISMDSLGKYHLHIPLAKFDRVGTDFSWGSVIGFEHVFVAKPADSAAAINQWLRSGFHVVLSPGIYHLEASLVLEKDNQVLLGIGFATLVGPEGAPAITVGSVDGVRVSGVLLEAGLGSADTLLQWGNGSHTGSALNPSFMHDVFVRVGGTNDPTKAQARLKVMIRVSSGHVVGDNVWLWRADHGISGIVKEQMNPCDTGLLVTGDHVTMYGLFAEHTLKDLVQWAGDNGRTYFFQSELPYDVTQAFGDAGYVGYRVNNTVRSHHAYGVGVYHYFRDHAVTVRHGISVPAWLENSFEAPLSVYLSGQGVMEHVINSAGARTADDSTQAEWKCSRGPEVPFAPPTTTTATSTSRTSTKTITSSTTTTSTRTSVTYTGTPTTTTTSTSSTTTSTMTRTTTRTTTTSTSLTSTTTETVTTTTTTTVVLLFWGLIPALDGRSVPWLLGAVIAQCGLVCVLVSCMCCYRKPRVEEGQVPMSRLLRLMSRRSGDRTRVHFTDSSPEIARSPQRSTSLLGGRTLSLLGSFSPNETTKLQLSPRVPVTPGRRGSGAARTLSMGSLADTTMSMSPGGPTMLSPWGGGGGGGNSPLWRSHSHGFGDGRGGSEV